MNPLQPYLDKISNITSGYMRSQILFVANEGGVFPLLEEPRTAPEVAESLGWDGRGTRMLLDGLVALELVEKQDGRYRNGDAASACLVPGKPGYQGYYLRHQRGSWDTWAKLDDAVKTGGAAQVNRPERTPEQLRNFILAMAELGRLSAEQMADAVDFSPYRHVLDLGGGPGTYSIVLLRRYPEMRATVLDRPAVIEIAKEQVRRAGLEDRFNYIAGDFLEVDFEQGYDLILLSNIIHMLSPEANRTLVAKCFEALEPGGALVIKDFLVDEDRSGPAFSLVFALHMLVNTGQGDTYPVSEVAAWTGDAGFEPGELVEQTPQTRLWVVKKPR